MNSPALLIDTREKPTGESLQAWLNQELSSCRTGQSKSINLVYHTSSNFHMSDSLDVLICGSPSTDPGANLKFRETYLVEWSQNLSQLSAAARAIIPGLRNLTNSERKNLQHYYRKLYRKF